MQDLARRILAAEAARATASGTEFSEAAVDVAVQVVEKFQAPLSKLTGPAGFSSLLSRSLVLAKAEVPTLRTVQVRRDGSLAGFDEIKPDPNAGEHAAGALEQGRVALVAHFMGLLATFIGESLTQRLACDAWPVASIEKTDLKQEETP